MTGSALGMASLSMLAPPAAAASPRSTAYTCRPTKYSIVFAPDGNAPRVDAPAVTATAGPFIEVDRATGTASQATDRLGLVTLEGAQTFSSTCAKTPATRPGNVPDSATRTDDTALVCSFTTKPQLALVRPSGAAGEHLYVIAPSRTTAVDAQLGGDGSALRYDSRVCKPSAASEGSSPASRMPPVPDRLVSAKELSKILGYTVASVPGEPDKATDASGGVVRSSTWGKAGGNGEVTVDVNGPNGSGAPWDARAAYGELVQNFDPSVTEQVAGLGDAATFRAEAGDDRLVVLHGDDVVVVKNLNGTTAGDTEGVDTRIARLVLGRL
jgi:hypothetical protein